MIQWLKTWWYDIAASSRDGAAAEVQTLSETETAAIGGGVAKVYPQ